MENEKDRFGETMRLVERAKEDIYFAAKDRELIEKLKARLRRVEKAGAETLRCPKCPGRLESYRFMEFLLDQCVDCGGVWLDKGELEGILKKVSRSSLASAIKKLIFGEADTEEAEGDAPGEKVHHRL
ncbi:MAG TPA: zf-TFIIB domain-containing protein [Candidatus Acidoferrales bacterium]|nr:zf-TFIIB domain-containing protein [Candidatus Acidoferrales bacterium]